MAEGNETDRRAETLRLAAESGADPRTVERWLDGGAVHRVTDTALRAAAAKLGIAPPEKTEQ